MTNNEELQQRITDLIQTQVPAFIREENPNFVTFMEAYYEWMETKFNGTIVGPNDGIAIKFTIDPITLENKIVLDALTTSEMVAIYSYITTGLFLNTNAKFVENRGPLNISKKESVYLNGNIEYIVENGPYNLLVQSTAHDLGFLGDSVPLLIEGTEKYNGKYTATIVDDNHFSIRNALQGNFYTTYVNDLPVYPGTWSKNFITIYTDNTVSEELLQSDRVEISDYVISGLQTRVYAPDHKLINADQITIIDSPDYDGTYIITYVDANNFLIDKAFVSNNTNSFLIRSANKVSIDVFEHLTNQSVTKTAVKSVGHLLSEGDQVSIVDSSYYNGTYTVAIIDKDYFEIDKIWLNTAEINVASWLRPDISGPTMTEDSTWIGAIFGSKKLPSYSDVDETIEEFLAYFLKEFMVNIPVSVLADKPKLIKNITQFYRTRGTEKSWKLLFRIMFNDTVSFYYPQQDILRCDDGRWYEDRSILVSPYTNSDTSPFDVVATYTHNRIIGRISGATGLVTEVYSQWNGTQFIYELVFEKNSITGTFVPWETVSLSISDINNKAKVLPILQDINITNQGSGYRWTDSVVTIASPYSDVKMAANIKTLGPAGEVLAVTITNHSLGYPVYPAIGGDIPLVTFVSKDLPDITATATATIGALIKYDGRYTGQYGFLDDIKKTRDDYFYQEFSYVVKTTGLSMNYFKTICKKLVHPAGLKMFCRIIIENNFEAYKAKVGSVNTNYDIISRTFTGTDSGREFVGYVTGDKTFVIAKDLWVEDALIGLTVKSYIAPAQTMPEQAINIVVSNINSTLIVRPETPLMTDCDTLFIPYQVAGEPVPTQWMEVKGTRISDTEFQTTNIMWPSWTSCTNLAGTAIYSYKSLPIVNYTECTIVDNLKDIVVVSGTLYAGCDTIEIENDNKKYTGIRLTDSAFRVEENLWPADYLVGKSLYVKSYTSDQVNNAYYNTVVSNTHNTITFNENLYPFADHIRILETRHEQRNITTVIRNSPVVSFYNSCITDVILKSIKKIHETQVFIGPSEAEAVRYFALAFPDNNIDESTMPLPVDVIHAGTLDSPAVARIPDLGRYGYLDLDTVVLDVGNLTGTQFQANEVITSPTASAVVVDAYKIDTNTCRIKYYQITATGYTPFTVSETITGETNLTTANVAAQRSEEFTGYSIYSYNANSNNGVYSRVESVSRVDPDTILTASDNLFTGATKFIVRPLPKYTQYKDMMSIIQRTGTRVDNYTFTYDDSVILNDLLSKRLISYDSTNRINRYESLILSVTGNDIVVDSPLHPTCDTIIVVLEDVENYWANYANYQLDELVEITKYGVDERRRSIICPEPRIYLTQGTEPVVIPAGPSFRFEIQIDNPGDTFTLPLLPGTHDFMVNWGDLTHSEITSDVDPDKTHTYASAGTYEVLMSGTCTAFGFNNSGDRLKITSLLNTFIGDMGFTTLNFYGCSNLTTLTASMSELKSLTTAESMFRGCTSLTAIPAGIFDGCTNITSFQYAFRNCSNITAIPANLFRYNTEILHFYGAFAGCNKLTTLPVDLFRYNTLVTEFRAVFDHCTGLTALPVDLFRYNTLVTSFGNNADYYCTFGDCWGLTELPVDLFRYNTLVTEFSGVFYNCINLTSIPVDLFRYNIANLDFSFVFYQCSRLAQGGIPVDVFKYNTLVTSFAYAFMYGYWTDNNTGFGYGLQIQDWFRYNTAAVDFQYAFYGCALTASIPADLFRYNTLAITFESAFDDCRALRLNSDIFYASGEQSTRFLNKTVNFMLCFNRTVYYPSTIGTAPDLWNCDFGTGTPTKSSCFAGVGNSSASLTNYTYIPIEWGGPAGSMVLNIQTTTTPQSITLPLGTGTHNFTVNWGDGSPVSTVISNIDANRIHSYVTPGNYNITMTGTCTNFSVNNVGTFNTALRAASFAGDMGFTTLNFYGCSNLTTVPATLDNLTHLTTALNMFNGCTSLYWIPVNPFTRSTGITSFEAAFRGCTSLSYLPSDLFRYNTSASTFYRTFYDCGLTSLPVNLFKYNTLATSFQQTFKNCHSLTTLPASLFRYNTNITNFTATFYDCYGLTSLPSDLFQYNTSVTLFGGVFQNCYGLTSLPVNLFSYNTSATVMEYAFYNCYGLTSLPVDLFRYNTLATTFSNTFNACYGLTSLPTDLFRYNTAATNFTYTLYNCHGLTSLPTDLFRYNTAATAFTYAMYNCYGLSTVPVDLFRYNTAVTSFNNTFRFCTSLATVPADLFRYNTIVTDFSSALYGCNKLQQHTTIFSAVSETGTRFLNQSPNFTDCFYRTAFTGTQGTAPDLWNYSYGSGTPTKTTCFSGAGNSLTSLTNYTYIPLAWGGPGASMALNIQTTTTPESITLPLGTGTHDFQVNWGDGTAISTVTSSADADRIHSYATPGNYNITMVGICTNFAFNGSGTTRLRVKSIVEIIGDMGFTTLNFYGCTGMNTAIPSSITNLHSLTTAANMFRGCTLLPSPIPAGIIDASPVSSIGQMFYGCTSLTSLPAALFGPSVGTRATATSVFQGCTGLTALPSDLFTNSPGIIYFSSTFNGCTYLATIPSGLFASNTSVTTFAYAFAGCTRLTAIPANLFDTNILAQDFSGVFSDCNNAALTTIPTDLFKYNPATYSFGSAFFNCNKLTAIPAGLFNYNPLVSTFNQVFYGCASLMAIPTNLFDNNTWAIPPGIDFSMSFQGCTGLTSIPTDLFKFNIVSLFNSTFRSCTGLTAIPAGLFSYNTTVTALAFETTFRDCTGLTGAAIPANLFDANTSVTQFYQTFYGCSGITTIPTDLFRYNTAVTNFTSVFDRCGSITAIPVDLFRYNTAATIFTTAFYADGSITEIPSGLFRYNTLATQFGSTFFNNVKAKSNIDIFYSAGEETTRFAGKTVNFTNCFRKDAAYTGVQGVAPDLWNCTFTSSTKTACFGGTGNSIASFANYADIPVAWK